MHLPAFSIAIVAIATLVSASPIEPLSSSVLDKPDGLYISELEADGSATLVEFTPLADILSNTTISSVVETTSIEARSSSVTCEGAQLNYDDLVRAWRCVIDGTPNPQYIAKDTAIWCKTQSVVAYACSYSANNFRPDVFQTALTTVSNTCGWLTAGYQRCKGDCGVSDMTMGRNYNGAAFCWKNHYG